MTNPADGDRVVHGAITLRRATDADYDFMRRLYAFTREEEMKRFPFSDAEKAAFLDQQFAAQFQHYGIHYPTCERNIVEKDGQPVGRLWIDEWRDQIRVVDSALVPKYRTSGSRDRFGPDLYACRRMRLPLGFDTGGAVTRSMSRSESPCDSHFEVR